VARAGHLQPNTVVKLLLLSFVFTRIKLMKIVSIFKRPLQFVKHAVEEIADGCEYAELQFLVAATGQWMLITPRGFPSTPETFKLRRNAD
jgi:hypothetical protein